MSQYRVVIVGMGKRGMHHATAFHANPKFQVVGICDIDQARLAAAAPKNTAVVLALVGTPPLQLAAVLQVLLLPPDHTKSAAKAGTDEKIPARRTGINNEDKMERHGLFIEIHLPFGSRFPSRQRLCDPKGHNRLRSLRSHSPFVDPYSLTNVKR